MRTLHLGDDASAPALHDLALKLRSSKRTVFVAGAGISCNAGIPDFRSKEGLYSLVKQQFPETFVQGKDLFDVILFRDAQSTQVFYSFMAGLHSATLETNPTPTHHFLKLLRDKKKLMRCYTQNIDGLEYRAGLGRQEAVQLHGDIHSLKCTHCSCSVTWTPEITEEMARGEAPGCIECINASLSRKLSGKRGTACGSLRPNIVLYGEEHPRGDAIASTLRKDCARAPQLLVVAGTSLKVVGIKRLVKSLAAATKAADGMVVFINKSAVNSSEWDSVFDFHVLSDTDAWVSSVKSTIPTFFERQTHIKVERKRKLTPAQPKSASSDNVVDIRKSMPEVEENRNEDEVGVAFPIMAKRTKSDPYGENNLQNSLLRSPVSVGTLSEDPETSPLLNMLDPVDDVCPLHFD